MIPHNASQPGGSFYDQWTAIQEDPNLSPQQRAGAEAQLVVSWLADVKSMCVSLLEHPKDAILETPLGVFVTKFRDTAEVFDNDEVFTVHQGYGERMPITTGAFMLGMDESEQYEREESLVKLALMGSKPTDLQAWLRKFATGWVEQIAKKRSSIDICQDIGYRIPSSFVGHYLGIPGPSQEAWTRWVQMLALYIFNFWAGGSPYKEEASAVGLEYQTYINNTIRQRQAAIKSGQSVPDDALSRMIQKGIANPADNLDEVAIRRNLGGLAIGSNIPPAANIIFAFDFIIDLKDSDPDTFNTIVRAAVDGDDTLLQNCMLEACRMGNTNPPSLYRTANEDYVLAKGTPREKLIPAGTTVVLCPGAAMMDPDQIDQPNEFRIDRPDWTYIMFGEGMHRCLGEQVGKIMLTETARAVFRLPGLRRAKGAAGKIQRGTGLPAGSYPMHLIFDFDPPSSSS